MKIVKETPDELTLSDSPRLLLFAFWTFALAAIALAVDGLLQSDYGKVLAGSFAAAVLGFFGAYAITATTAAFSTKSGSVIVTRKSLLSTRGEVYPLTDLKEARVHSAKTSNGRNVYVITLVFEKTKISDIQQISDTHKMNVKDIRGVAGFTDTEFPLLNYAESTGKKNKTALAARITAWITASHKPGSTPKPWNM